MSDHVLVEGVRSKLALGGLELQLVASDEPQQISFAAAVGAVALDRLLKVPVHIECDLAAMAAALVHHASPVSGSARLNTPR
jgi:hypothetical protein